ncbi:aspartate/glutamate racemase family protein [Limimaricola cinnabarinus]|uniref:Aspartate racemase n=1 Tax=Limimaricola cinnabarinus TaxID=1125964 RepID=A0A2G1MEA1_9RHOB|nr:amino acid racemase [Limimaricola cinnabarinus]PHP27058.1 aspartate racemase [Limimaricola cinnabarinus]
MSPKRIGILGGMGPEATVLLMQRLIAATPARDDADHIPLLVDMNPQVPSRIARLIEGRGEDPGPVLAAMARGLEAGGATALAMPCNTAHHYAPEIRAAVSVPFIDMIALSVGHAARLAGPSGKVGLLGSPALRRIGIFDRACAEAGLILLHPADEEALLAAIRAIKAHGPDEESRAALHAASADLAERGAALQLVACTEFSLIAEALVPGAEGIDTLDRLVDGIRAAATGARNKAETAA